MKTEKEVRRSYRARYNQMRAKLDDLQVLADCDPDTIEGVYIGDMRDLIEQIDQCFHEFSAYWNVVNT